MVTCGYYIFRYKGIYYYFYQHGDAYPEHLGYLLVNDIRDLTDEDFETIKETLEVMPEPIDDGERKTKFIVSIMDTITHYSDKDYHITDEEQIIYSYSYIIDLDRELFIAKNFNHDLDKEISQFFDLYNIPANWIELFEHYVENVEVVVQ
jgi:hypothetical protein